MLADGRGGSPLPHPSPRPRPPMPARPQLRGTRDTLSNAGGSSDQALQLGLPGEPFTFESHAKATGMRVTAATLSGNVSGPRAAPQLGAMQPTLNAPSPLSLPCFVPFSCQLGLPLAPACRSNRQGWLRRGGGVHPALCARVTGSRGLNLSLASRHSRAARECCMSLPETYDPDSSYLCLLPPPFIHCPFPSMHPASLPRHLVFTLPCNEHLSCQGFHKEGSHPINSWRWHITGHAYGASACHAIAGRR